MLLTWSYLTAKRHVINVLNSTH